MINKVILIGRLTSKIELKETNEKIPYAYFTLAVNKEASSSDAEFIPCVVWRKTAEFMAKYLDKGSLVFIEGKLNVFTENKEGAYETKTTVNVSKVQSLEFKALKNEESSSKEESINLDEIKF